jgi:hypothetical protein
MFSFLGQTAYVIHDTSFIWDERRVYEESLKLLTAAITFVASLTDESDVQSSIRLIGHTAKCAVWWRRLLQLGATDPARYSQPLFELLLTPAIACASETVKEVGDLLGSAYQFYSPEQRIRLEHFILRIPDHFQDERRATVERIRDRLIVCIPSGLLTTGEAISYRAKLDQSGTAPSNEPVATFRTWSEAYTTEKWLSEQGVAVEKPKTKAVLLDAETLEQFHSKYLNTRAPLSAVAALIPVARHIFEIVQDESLEPVLQENLWTRLAQFASHAATAFESAEGDAYCFVRDVLLICSKHHSPEPTEQDDVNFRQPSWSPTPRIEATHGLAWLALISPESNVLQQIETLLADPVPSVRFLMVSEIFRLSNSAPDYMWSLLAERAIRESHPVVLQSLFQVLGRLLSGNASKVKEVLRSAQRSAQQFLLSSEVGEAWFDLVVFLCVRSDDAWSKETLNKVFERPFENRKSLRSICDSASRWLEPHDGKLPQDVELARASSLVSRCLDAAGVALRQRESKDDEEIRATLTVFEIVIRRARFVFDKGNSSEEQNVQLKKEVSKKLWPIYRPLVQQVIEIAESSDIGPLPAPVAHDLMELLVATVAFGAKVAINMAARTTKIAERHGYHLDSLAVKQVVDLVERLLADYRYDLRDPACLADVVKLLDVFANAGWPEAMSLLWRLDQVFR